MTCKHKIKEEFFIRLFTKFLGTTKDKFWDFFRDLKKLSKSSFEYFLFAVLKQKIRILKWLDINEKQTTFYLEIWQEKSENCLIKTRSRRRFSNKLESRSRSCMHTLDSKTNLKFDLAIHSNPRKRERGRFFFLISWSLLLEPQEPLGNGVFLCCEEEGGRFSEVI